MSTDIKLSKAHLSKIIQPGWCLGKMLGNLDKKTFLDFTIPSVTEATLSVLHKFERKISWKGVVRAGKRFTLFI